MSQSTNTTTEAAAAAAATTVSDSVDWYYLNTPTTPHNDGSSWPEPEAKRGIQHFLECFQSSLYKFPNK